MNLKYLFAHADPQPGRGPRLYILAPWGDANPSVEQLRCSLNGESKWGGSTYGNPNGSGFILSDPTVYVLGWEFDPFKWKGTHLVNWYISFHNEFTWEAISSMGHFRTP